MTTAEETKPPEPPHGTLAAGAAYRRAVTIKCTARPADDWIAVRERSDGQIEVAVHQRDCDDNLVWIDRAGAAALRAALDAFLPPMPTETTT